MTQKVVNYDVAGYPDCMNTGCNVMAVMCQDEQEFLACYVGVVRLVPYNQYLPEDYQESKRIAADYVMRWGQKQTEKQARKYFMFPEEKYRE